MSTTAGSARVSESCLASLPNLIAASCSAHPRKAPSSDALRYSGFGGLWTSLGAPHVHRPLKAAHHSSVLMQSTTQQHGQPQGSSGGGLGPGVHASGPDPELLVGAPLAVELVAP